MNTLYHKHGAYALPGQTMGYPNKSCLSSSNNNFYVDTSNQNTKRHSSALDDSVVYLFSEPQITTKEYPSYKTGGAISNSTQTVLVKESSISKVICAVAISLLFILSFI